MTALEILCDRDGRVRVLSLAPIRTTPRRCRGSRTRERPLHRRDGTRTVVEAIARLAAEPVDCLDRLPPVAMGTASRFW
ncbi:hypothetical protein C8039_00375 [Halogeometricum sp. wsp3]|nr:hypothetical protein C8039_00375 [Halogeometricum sp. wsp3]